MPWELRRVIFTTNDTYDANGEYAFTEKRTYTPIGKIASQTDAVGREVLYTYDGMGNQISRFIPLENRSISTTYDFHNLPIQIVENNSDESITLYNSYDVLGRKIATPDASGFDHEFMSPTYREQLQRHIRNYTNTQGKML